MLSSQPLAALLEALLARVEVLMGVVVVELGRELATGLTRKHLDLC